MLIRWQVSFFCTLPVFKGVGPVRLTNTQIKVANRKIGYLIKTTVEMYRTLDIATLETEVQHLATTRSSYKFFLLTSFKELIERNELLSYCTFNEMSYPYEVYRSDPDPIFSADELCT